MLEQYKQARQGLIEMLSKLGDSEQDIEDRKLLNSMKRDTEYMIKWFRLGYDPENPQGVNIKDAYNIERHENMDIFPDINEQIRAEREQLHELTTEERTTIIRLINNLSDRERDCFLLRIEGFTLRDIANELSISISSVQKYLDRAEKKVRDVQSKDSKSGA